MQRSLLSMIGVMTLIGMTLSASSSAAAQDNKTSVSVAFGRGLNTAQPGNSVNHAMLPDEIKVKENGVVHFLVAGFHQITIYNPGKNEDEVVVPGTGLFIDDANERFYQGIKPAGGPPPGLPQTTDPSNAQNRVESVSFSEPGTYLVICNIRGHFLDGMFGFVEVKKGKSDD
jgi:uncharacterized cupredoxin-like copper-binding protein